MKMDSFTFVICLVIVLAIFLVIGIIVIRDKENKIIFKMLGIFKQKRLEIEASKEFHLKVSIV